jgi:hypothetical protein
VGHLQQREGHWAIVDLRGKAGHVRTIPVPDWVHGLLDDWTTVAGINTGNLFRRVSSAGGSPCRAHRARRDLAPYRGQLARVNRLYVDEDWHLSITPGVRPMTSTEW